MARNLRHTGRPRTSRTTWQPALERLEARMLCYSPSGSQWAAPNHISYSIPADGVFWDHGFDNLNSSMNGRFGSGVWQRELARALQTWAAAANLEITRSSDANLQFNTPGQPQGDPRFGDIRIGGYPFSDPSVLAQTYFPPPNGLTAAGDSEINTAVDWSIGSGTDLYSALLHEFGHSLGLSHSLNPSAVMNATYGGVRTGLTPDDIAGIQSIYGRRLADVYQSHGSGLSLGNAIDLTPSLDAARQASVAGVELATIGDTEYYSVVAPALNDAALQVVAVADGLSLLSPRVSVYDASGTLLDTRGDPSAWGDNVQAGVALATPGQRYYIAVTGATQDVFAVGAYRLQVAFVGGTPVTNPPPPVIEPPPVVIPPNPPIAPDRFEPNNVPNRATRLGLISGVVLDGLTLDSPSDVDNFLLRTVRAGIYQVSTGATVLRVLDARGRVVAQGLGGAAFWSARAGARYYFVVSAPWSAPVATYSLTIALQPSARGLGSRRHSSSRQLLEPLIVQPVVSIGVPASSHSPQTRPRAPAGPEQRR